MNVRRVVVTIEVETDATIKAIKEYCKQGYLFGEVQQVQANVIKKEKPKAKK